MNQSKPIKAEAADCCHTDLHIVNSSDRAWTKRRFVLAFGAYGDTYLLVWANSVDSALDECVDYIAEHLPGLLCDDEVKEAYEAAIAEGKSEEEAQAIAETDVTTAGNEGHHLHSWEWTIVCEDPTRTQILEMLGRIAS